MGVDAHPFVEHAPSTPRSTGSLPPWPTSGLRSGSSRARGSACPGA